MSGRRPGLRMRPVDAIDPDVEERVARRSHSHRRRLRAMVQVRRWFRRFGRTIVLTVLLLVAGVLGVAQTGRGQGFVLEVVLARAEQAIAFTLGPIVPCYNIAAVLVLLACQHRLGWRAVGTMTVRVMTNPLLVACVAGVMISLLRKPVSTATISNA